MAAVLLGACQQQSEPVVKLLIVGRGTSTVIDYPDEATCAVQAERLARSFDAEVVGTGKPPEMRAYCIAAEK